MRKETVNKRDIHRPNITREIIEFVKNKRRELGFTQKDLAYQAGVGLRFIRDLEQGKDHLRTDKVNEVLLLFGYKLGPIPLTNRDEL
ncbi:MAG: helix-turn-helix transcriptional regulator [Bacteroidetes bacterium]|nr:helix-turn-helix transcriptional regulator [Bacteroidota bacterium]MCH8524849.1 helix-turn-helix domain-containing protein [Balneolales bacterium]